MKILLLALTLVAQEAPLAVQGAVDSELEPLLTAIGNPPPRVIHGFAFWEGDVAGRKVVVSRTEVGMVHAAAATTILIQEFHPALIINQGTAGAVDPELKVGDIVVGSASAPFGAFRTERRGKGEGVSLEGWSPMPRLLREGDDRVSYERFASDPELRARAMALPYERGRLVEGIVGSADQWNREIDKLIWARARFGIASEDMESAAVHQVAQIFGVPFLPLRIISNSEYHDPEFRRELGYTCAEFALSFVRHLASPEAQR